MKTKQAKKANKTRRTRAKLNAAVRDLNRTFRVGSEYMVRALHAEHQVKVLTRELRQYRAPYYWAELRAEPSETPPVPGAIIPERYDAGHSPAGGAP